MSEPVKNLTSFQRKARKLKNHPKQFLVDSKAYLGTRKAAYIAWAQLGSFAFVLLASLIIIAYYSVIASPRYAVEAQFIVKQSGNNEPQLMGLASLANTSSTTRDALIIKEFILSRDMLLELDQAIALKDHYQSSNWDWFSRLKEDASTEEFLEYFNDHISVTHDEMADIVYIEVQAFSREYALNLGQQVLRASEKFINNLGDKMAKEQMAYAQDEVSRLYQNLKEKQRQLLDFQNANQLFSPEKQGSALLSAISELQSSIIKQEARLKEMKAVMQESSSQVRSQRVLLDSLRQQLAEEKNKLTSEDNRSLNQVSARYEEIKLSIELATSLYQSALSSMEVVRSDAYKKLKHLLMVESPSEPQDDKYPRRIYSIFTWFAGLLLIYLLYKLIFAVVKEHKD